MQQGGAAEHEVYHLLGQKQKGLIDYGGGIRCISNTSGMQRSFCSSNSSYYPLEFSPHDRALAALKNHKEAEKRRRERINSHLDNLRTLLPCNSKTDKATLLGKVVERVRELKEETSGMREMESLPSETDEVSVVDCSADSDTLVFKASLCCEDRSDLIPDVIEILKSLHFKTLRSEIATLGGRIRSVLFLAAEHPHRHSVESLHFLHAAFKSLLERSNSSSERSKRRRGLDRKILSFNY